LNAQPGSNAPQASEKPPANVVACMLSWTREATPRVLSRIGKGLYLVGGAGMVLVTLIDGMAGAMISMLSTVSYLFWLVSYALSLSQTTFQGALEATPEGLAIHEKSTVKRVPLQEIVSALVVERRTGPMSFPTLEIRLQNGDVLTARAQDGAALYAMASVLGFGPTGKRVRVSLAKPTRRLLHPLMGLGAYAATWGTAAIVALLVASRWRGDSPGLELFALIPLLMLGFYALIASFFRAPEVIVGDDGVRMKRRWRTRAVPLDVPVRGVLLDEERRAAVSALARARAAAPASLEHRMQHYMRAGRAFAEWKEELTRAMRDPSYRTNAATVDDAATVLSSATATAETRLGAALALRVAGEPPERIRVAAAAVADDELRSALEAVADGDDERAEKALRRL
jgi:hypothetical protein